ncbi:arylsulfatase [Halorientalis sp. IM1011]|uniref:sulfatase n=1 Tax=Halorientalis sp. IM1011 TaxID=1932360 RepID=UPI00097CC503|nr:sulfatase [Halorientalis sp. IM1011]AQL42257.1 arylsulfatase [Halorientalis sp. IM1011]
MHGDWENVALLSFDALRADHLGCYGYERDTSPVLDELAEECLRFENAYSASSHTREAVPAILTGEYPDTAIDAKYHLVTETIASDLSNEGFATGGFHSNPFVSRAYGFDRGFAEFDDDLHFGSNKLVALAQRLLDKLRNRHYARADEINKRSISWVESLDDEPFFLWNHYMDTHGPYEPPGEYRERYGRGGVSDKRAQSLYQRAIDDPESITDEERQLLIDCYDAEIAYNDAQVGEFLDELESRGVLEESLLIVTADHGDAFGEHDYYEHPRYLHDEITKVPLFVRPPGGADGDVVSTPVSTLDVAATIGDAVGVDREYVGASLFDVSGNRSVFQQARGEDEHAHVRRYAVRSESGVCFCKRDTETGSLEFGDCSDRSLREELEAHVDERIRAENGGASGDDSEVDEEIDRRLSALGYKE